MKNIDFLIIVASWEERFFEGLKRDIEKYKLGTIYMFYYESYKEWTEKFRNETKEICNNKKIELKTLVLNFFEPAKNWEKIENLGLNTFQDNSECLIDITTMPRDTIWSILYQLNRKKIKINYVYHSVKTHSNEWLSRNPDKPRLIYKLSGITKLGKPTLLIILAGYDFQRVMYLINHFEPKKVFIGMNTKENSDNQNKEYLLKYSELSENGKNKTFKYEICDNKFAGYQEIENYILEFKDSYNIILSSLGLKLTALTVFKLVQKYPEISLTYIPCKEYNKEYSQGIDKSFFGKLKKKI